MFPSAEQKNERWRGVASGWNCCCRPFHTPDRLAYWYQRWGSVPRFPCQGWRQHQCLHPPSPATSWGHLPPLEPHHFTALEHYNTTQRTSKTHTTLLTYLTPSHSFITSPNATTSLRLYHIKLFIFHRKRYSI